MRWPIVVAALFASFCSGQKWTLYTCMSTTKGYVVGAKLLASGVFRRNASGAWEQVGHMNPFTFGLDYDRRNPSRLYLAAGNGIIRLTTGAKSWRILTGSDVTEMRDVMVDPGTPDTIYYSHVAGIRVSRDAGVTWTELSGGLRRKYTEVIRVDRTKPGVLLAGGEDGIFRSVNHGASWSLAGAAGFSVMRIEQSPHDACFWLAATERGGLFASRDCGGSFESVQRLGVDRNLYDIAFDPAQPGRIAVVGWGFGVAVSEDNGKTWELRNTGLPSIDVWSAAFDPGEPGRLYAGVHEEALYVSPDAGKTWKPDGLPGTIITRMQFVPEAAR